MISWPPFTKGGIGAVRRAVKDSEGPGRTFRAGEVIVPVGTRNNDTVREKLQSSFIYGGIDYRIMTITDQDGNEIFSTGSLPFEERASARLALRPCGWKTQRQLWQLKGMTTDWPVEVEAGLLSNFSLTRFNTGSALPRLVSAFQRDLFTYTLAIAIAFTPIPIALLARNVVSFYAIPSASMEPTFLRGDVLLVEKLPKAFERSKRGDVILFEPPQSLLDVVANRGSKLSSGSLFVKRIVGLPGDKNIAINDENDVSIDNHPVVGPDRSLCSDEPLKLIEKMIDDGEGKYIKSLGKNEVYVLGDCKAVSVDSRVFGSLETNKIVGKPIARVWPLNRWNFLGPF
jgi:signal peptidase I